MAPKTDAEKIYARIYAVIRRIPEGKVATYGQVATLAGFPGHARQVGQALRSVPVGVTEVPWQRVINAKGEVSNRGGRGGLGWEEGYQRHRLEEEGVEFDPRGRIDLERFGWEPPKRRGS